MIKDKKNCIAVCNNDKRNIMTRNLFVYSDNLLLVKTYKISVTQCTTCILFFPNS